jgi:hypothetical protein
MIHKGCRKDLDDSVGRDMIFCDCTPRRMEDWPRFEITLGLNMAKFDFKANNYMIPVDPNLNLYE